MINEHVQALLVTRTSLLDFLTNDCVKESLNSSFSRRWNGGVRNVARHRDLLSFSGGEEMEEKETVLFSEERGRLVFEIISNCMVSG